MIGNRESANEIMAAALEFLDKRRECRRRRMEAEAKAQREWDEKERKAAEAWVAKRMAEKRPDELIAPDYVPLPGSQLNIFGYPIDKVREATGMAPFKARQDEALRKLDAMEEYYKTQFNVFDYRKGEPAVTFGDGKCINRPVLFDITPELMQMDLGYVPFHDIPFDLDEDEDEEE